MRISSTVIMSGPIMDCHITVGSPYPDVWLAARGDMADCNWSTQNHRGKNPQRIRTLTLPVPCNLPKHLF